MRPVLFFPAWSTLLLAYISEKSITDHQFILFHSDLLIRLFSFACIMGASFIINQITDIDSDKENKKLPILSSGKLSINESWYFAIFLMIITLVLSYYYDLYIFYLNLLFLIITAYLYNIRPFVLKNRPVLGAIANYLMGILAYLYALDRFQIMDLDAFVLISAINFSLFILTTLPDVKGDRKINKRTIGSVLGVRKALILNAAIIFIFLLLSVIYDYKVSIISYLFYFQCLLSVCLLFNSTTESIVFVIKLFLLIQAFLVCVFFSDYFIFLIMMYLGGRMYYKKYFNLNYPHIKNE
jgi:4-hydroxybenzoate polyprenyltransferase